MAVHVEDHPIEYIDFEGVIPAGEYGGGDVIVWDAAPGSRTAPTIRRPRSRPASCTLEVYGEKLRGRFVLVRRDDGDGRDGGKEQWLLLHKRDEHAVDGWDPEDHPQSVLSGRTNDEVKADPERLWRSDLPAAEASIPVRPAATGPSDDELAALDALGEKGTWEVFGRDAAAHQPRQGAVPGPRGRARR